MGLRLGFGHHRHLADLAVAVELVAQVRLRHLRREAAHPERGDTLVLGRGELGLLSVRDRVRVREGVRVRLRVRVRARVRVRVRGVSSACFLALSRYFSASRSSFVPWYLVRVRG